MTSHLKRINTIPWGNLDLQNLMSLVCTMIENLYFWRSIMLHIRTDYTGCISG